MAAACLLLLLHCLSAPLCQLQPILLCSPHGRPFELSLSPLKICSQKTEKDNVQLSLSPTPQNSLILGWKMITPHTFPHQPLAGSCSIAAAIIKSLQHLAMKLYYQERNPKLWIHQFAYNIIDSVWKGRKAVHHQLIFIVLHPVIKGGFHLTLTIRSRFCSELLLWKKSSSREAVIT